MRTDWLADHILLHKKAHLLSLAFYFDTREFINKENLVRGVVLSLNGYTCTIASLSAIVLGVAGTRCSVSAFNEGAHRTRETGVTPTVFSSYGAVRCNRVTLYLPGTASFCFVQNVNVGRGTPCIVHLVSSPTTHF